MKLKEIPQSLLPKLNQLITNKRSFYEALSKKGFYLPPYKNRGVTGEYLWKVFTEEVICPSRNNIKIGYLPEKVTAIELFYALEEELGQG